jgi:hypothetical protein
MMFAGQRAKRAVVVVVVVACVEVVVFVDLVVLVVGCVGVVMFVDRVVVVTLGVVEVVVLLVGSVIWPSTRQVWYTVKSGWGWSGCGVSSMTKCPAQEALARQNILSR